jgi:LytS/YehU family sensor histidine kinase
VHTLQLLAENIVKHNAASSRQPLKLEIKSDQDCVYIKNNLLPKQHAGESSGIGLNNINKRYALLFGKEISIIKTESDFTVSLPIINNNEDTNHRR